MTETETETGPDATTTRYYELPDGRLRALTVCGDVSVLVPEDAVEVTSEEHAAAVDVIEQARADEEDARERAQQADALAAYTALSLLLPEDVARRLSGYTPPGGHH
ncbi:hypothetical protein [[Kitasatospora] papulosa]|uniref:hypothetical protein n=1 Tax=[Kitasatospora] papulosa TaxID=1464011 RepID=UPI0036BA7CF6